MKDKPLAIEVLTIITAIGEGISESVEFHQSRRLNNLLFRYVNGAIDRKKLMWHLGRLRVEAIQTDAVRAGETE